MAALSLIVFCGILFSVVVSHDYVVVGALLIVMGIIMYFGRLFSHHLIASIGTISADTVDVRPCRVLGFQLPGPIGSFSIQQFSAVRVEHVFGGPNENTPLLEFGRVTLIGKKGTPDIPVARVDFPLAQSLGKSLCVEFGILYEEKLRPY